VSRWGTDQIGRTKPFSFFGAKEKELDVLDRTNSQNGGNISAILVNSSHFQSGNITKNQPFYFTICANEHSLE
jgi:hypothetical protein